MSTHLPSHTVTLQVDIVASLKETQPLSGFRSVPSFRFALWTGTRVSTEPFGSASWTPVVVPGSATTPSSIAAELPVAKGAKPVSPRSAASTVDANGSGGGATREKLLRHRTVIENFTMNKESAQKLAAAPPLAVFCGIRLEAATASDTLVDPAAKKAAAPAKTTPTAAAAVSSSSSSSTVRPWAFWIPLDLSALLNDSVSVVSVAHGDRAALLCALGLAADNDIDISTIVGAPLPAINLPAPALFNFLAVYVKVVSATMLMSELSNNTSAIDALFAASDRNRDGVLDKDEFKGIFKSKDANALDAHFAATDLNGDGEIDASELNNMFKLPIPMPTKSVPPPAKVAAPAAKPVATSKAAPAPAAVVVPVPPLLISINPPRLLSKAIREAINPLSLQIHSASGLPGLRIPEGSDLKHFSTFLSPDAFQVQRKNCAPSYAVFELPDILNANASALIHLPDAPRAYAADHTARIRRGLTAGLTIAYPPRRVAFTPALPPGSRAQWDTTTVVCAGGESIPPALVRELLESTGIVVRVHDRDCLPYEIIQEVAALGGSAMEPLAPSLPSPLLTPKVDLAAPAAAASSSSPRKGGSGAVGGTLPTSAAAVAAGVAVASSSAPLGPSIATLASAIIPAFWPWPVLSHARVGLYESMLSGTVPLPLAADGSALIPWWGGPPISTTPTSPPQQPASAKTPVVTAAAAAAAAPLRPDQFDIDALYIAEIMSRVSKSSNVHAHGVGVARLDGLLNNSRGGLSGTSVRSLQIPITAAHRAIRAKVHSGAHEATYALSREEALIITPGDYCASGTILKLSASLSAPLSSSAPPAAAFSSTLAASSVLADEMTRAGAEMKSDFSTTLGRMTGTLGHRVAAEGPLERIVIIFPYDDDAYMLRLLISLDKINTAAVPHAPALDTYMLSVAEKKSIAAHELDVITSLHVTDGHQRICIFEGLGGVGKGIEALRLALPPRPDPSDTSILVLTNTATRFHSRLYMQDTLALRVTRLRCALDTLTANSVIYDGKTTSPDITAAVCALTELASRRVATLALARALGDVMWPSLVGVDKLQTEHGAEISLRDIYGALHPAAHAVVETQARLEQVLGLVERQRPAAGDATQLLSETRPLPTMIDPTPPLLSSSVRGNARDSMVSIKELMTSGTIRRDENPIDFVSSNVRAANMASESGAAKRRFELLSTQGPMALTEQALNKTGQTCDTLGRAMPGDGQIYLYSSQKLNTGEWARRLQRDRLLSDRGATFARSNTTEFGALHMSLDPTVEESREAALAASRAAWRTTRGFVYPVATTRVEDLEHPKAKGLASNERYIESTDALVDDAANVRKFCEATGRESFKSHAAPWPLGNSNSHVGYVDPSTGKGTFGWKVEGGDGNTGREFFTSVYRGTEHDGEEAARAEAISWEARLVTDPAFHYYQPKDTTRLERLGSILRGEAKTVELQSLKTGSIMAGTGKRTASLQIAPVSIHSMEPFIDALPIERTLRAVPVAKAGSPGGTAAKLFRETFIAPGGRDFKHAAEPDIVHKPYTILYKPLLTAARKTDAPPGERTAALIPPHVRGINTDNALSLSLR